MRLKFTKLSMGLALIVTLVPTGIIYALFKRMSATVEEGMFLGSPVVVSSWSDTEHMILGVLTFYAALALVTGIVLVTWGAYSQGLLAEAAKQIWEPKVRTQPTQSQAQPTQEQPSPSAEGGYRDMLTQDRRD